MTDAVMEHFLEASDLHAYSDTFKRHEIDFETLKALSDAELLQIFDGKLGPKVRLQIKLHNFLKSSGNINSSAEITSERRNESLHLHTWIKSEEKDLGTNFCIPGGEDFIQGKDPLEPSQKEQEREERIKAPNIEDLVHLKPGCSLDLTLDSTSDLTSITTVEDLESFLEENLSVPEDSSTVVIAKPSDQPPTSGQRKRKLPERDVDEYAPVLNKKALVDNSKVLVESFLNLNCVGRSALAIGRREKELDSNTRGKVCHEVIVGFLGADGRKLITPSDFQVLADGIVCLFPKETLHTYYVPRKPAHGLEPATHPKGLLYDKYHNILKFLRLGGLRDSIRSSGKSSQHRVTEIESHDPDLEEDIHWLEHHSVKSQVVTKQKWSKTAQLRLWQLRNSVDRVSKTKTGSEKVDSYLQRFPCLTQRWGLELLVSDFETLYGGKYVSLIENWPTVRAKLLQLAKKTDNDIGTNETVKCLRLIPTFFKQPMVCVGGGKTSTSKQAHWRPNLTESCQGFLLHVKTMSDLDKELHLLKAKCESVKRTLQPLAAVVGENDSGTEDSYVVIDNWRYNVESPLVAVDTCFKLFHALHCHYPCQSSYSWLFLQLGVYDLKTDWDFVAPAVATYVNTYCSISP